MGGIVWSEQQVKSLNDFQRAGAMHPFTCDRCRFKLGTWSGNDHVQRCLVATPEGWVCPTCDYTQDWAHPFMLDGSWRALVWPQSDHEHGRQP